MRADVLQGIPKDAPRWLYEALYLLTIGQDAAAQGLQAIIRGEAPDGSGEPLVPVGDFFLLAGRVGGQIGHGATEPSGTLTLSSTASASKGNIFFGVAQTTMFDETNQRLGINLALPPLARVHMRSTALSQNWQRWEGVAGSPITVVCNGTTTVTSAALFAGVSINDIVNGVGVTNGTTVTARASDSSITVSNAIPGTTTSLTFTPQITFVDHGFTGSGALSIAIGGGGVQPSVASGLRLTTSGDGRPDNSTTRMFVQAGPTNHNFCFGGHNAANGNSFWYQSLYHAFTTWAGIGTALTSTTRVGINIDPFDFSGSVAANQPGSLLIARRTAETATVATVAIEGTIAATTMALAIKGPSTAGPPPNRSAAQTYIGGFRHNGAVLLTDASTQRAYLMGSNLGTTPGFDFRRTADDSAILIMGRQTAWGDSIAGTFAHMGDLISTHTAIFFASPGFGIHTRFGISSAYTLISNGQAGGGSGAFPAPEASPSVLRLLNTSTAGADASIVLKVETLRAGQTGRLISLVGSAGEVAGMTAAGNYFLLSGAALGRVYTSDAGGVGSWGLASALATRTLYRWAANGFYRVGTTVDGAWIAPTAFTVSAVWIHRNTPGTSSSTILDLNKNGTTMYTTQANRPTIAFNDADNKVQATNPDVTSVAAGDILTIDIDQIEGGLPGDIILVLQGA